MFGKKANVLSLTPQRFNDYENQSHLILAASPVSNIYLFCLRQQSLYLSNLSESMINSRLVCNDIYFLNANGRKKLCQYKL